MQRYREQVTTGMSDEMVHALAVVIVVGLYAVVIVVPARSAYPYVRRYLREQLQVGHTAGQWITECVRCLILVAGIALAAAMLLDLMLWPMGAFTDPPTVARAVQLWTSFLTIELIDLLLCVIVYSFERKREAHL